MSFLRVAGLKGRAHQGGPKEDPNPRLFEGSKKLISSLKDGCNLKLVEHPVNRLGTGGEVRGAVLHCPSGLAATRSQYLLLAFGQVQLAMSREVGLVDLGITTLPLGE